jgi:cytochrome oxidase Cu insertion factor (SCO1/SenC/PrrC family)
MKVSRRKLFERLSGAALLALLSLAAGGPAPESGRSPDHDYDPPAAGSYSLPIVEAAGDGNVLDSDGSPLRLRELTRGRITVLSFIYTRCAAVKACPYATGVLNELHQLSQEDRALADHLRLVSMSFDPGSDTPQRMADYSAWARARKTGCEWRFLTTRSQAELQPILDAYGQAVDKRANPADPQGPLYHIMRVYLIDARGQVRNIYNSDTLDARLVLADIKTLLLDKPAGSTR